MFLRNRSYNHPESWWEWLVEERGDILISSALATTPARVEMVLYVCNEEGKIYTIILHKSVCRSSQTADRNSCSIVSGRCIKLFVSTEGPSSHEFASQFGVAILFLYAKNTQKLCRESRIPRKCQWNEIASDPSKRGGNAGRSRSTPKR